LVTAVATVFALPNLIGGADDMIVTNLYNIVDYVCLAFVIVSTVLLLITVISVISAYAKTIKEASTAVLPLMAIVMMISVTGMLGGSVDVDLIYYLIPLYNSVQGMSGVFSMDYSIASIAVLSVSNLLYACFGGFVLTIMFNSEKIMFKR
jgi:sodium transport system permease protein